MVMGVRPMKRGAWQFSGAIAPRSILGADRARRCEVVLYHGHRRRRISRGQSVAAARLCPEFGNILLVIVDHVPADLTIESAAVEVAQKERLTPRLWRQRRSDAQTQPRRYGLGLGEPVAVVANEHRTEIADLRVRAPVLDHAAKRHLRIIAVDGLAKELRGRRCKG